MPWVDCQTFGRKSRMPRKLLIKMFNEHGLDVPSGMSILHLCDNPPCSNIEHLMLGTYSENSRQAHERNRQKNCFESGENHIGKKLSNNDVDAVFKIRKDGFTQSYIAKVFNVNQSEISRILSGKRWSIKKDGEYAI